jgi:hypothetical protein
MVRVYEAGAEIASMSVGYEVDTRIGAGTFDLETTVTRGSRYSYKCNLTSTDGVYNKSTLYSSPTTNDVYAKFDFYIGANGLWAFSTPIIFQLQEGGTRVLQLQMTSSGSLKMLDTNDSVVVTGPTLSTGTWYCIEVRFAYNAGGSVGYLRVDGVDYGNGTVGDGSTRNKVEQILFGSTAGYTALGSTTYWYFDNLLVNDSSGSSQTSWVGEQRLVYASPISQGDAPASGDYYWEHESGGISSGDTTNYTRVDEMPWSTSDYVRKNSSDSGQYATDWYVPETYSTLGIGANDDITVLAVGGYMSGTGGTVREFTYIYQETSGGTKVSSSALSAAANADFIYDVNDVVGKPLHIIYPTALTGSDVNNMQFGVEASMDNARQIRCNCCWLSISYTPEVTAVARSYGFIIG